MRRAAKDCMLGLMKTAVNSATHKNCNSSVEIVHAMIGLPNCPLRGLWVMRANDRQKPDAVALSLNPVYPYRAAGMTDRSSRNHRIEQRQSFSPWLYGQHVCVSEHSAGSSPQATHNLSARSILRFRTLHTHRWSGFQLAAPLQTVQPEFKTSPSGPEQHETGSPKSNGLTDELCSLLVPSSPSGSNYAKECIATSRPQAKPDNRT
jgi:hypothetical protein